MNSRHKQPLKAPQISKPMTFMRGFPGGTVVKESTCQCRRHQIRGFIPWVGKIPWRRKWQLTPVFLPRKFQTEEPGGLQSMGSHRVGQHTCIDFHEASHYRRLFPFRSTTNFCALIWAYPLCHPPTSTTRDESRDTSSRLWQVHICQ